MSLALIEESAKEVRRLAIAGSPLAVGDFRLKKLIPPLEQAGAKVPVFAQVAKAISDLVNGPEADSAGRLLHLSTLLNAILYTQGQSGAEGELRELDVCTTKNASTRTPARLLKPLIQALTSAGAGRLEIVKSACERGAFNDLRLIEPALRALGDNYPEIADLAAEKILPSYGPGIVPVLKRAFDPKGKKHDARKLSVMHRLDPDGTLDLCKTALDDGSAEVKAAALACLGKHRDCLPLVLEHAKGKNKALKAAALEALAEHDQPEITALFVELIKGRTLDLLPASLRAIRNAQVLHCLLDEGKRVFDLLVKGDAEQIPRFWEILDCLDKRNDGPTEEFLLACFGNSARLAKLKAAQKSTQTGADLYFRLASMLFHIGTPKALHTLLAARETLPPEAFPLVLSASLRTWPADKVFSEFSPLLEQKKGVGKEKADTIERFMFLARWDDSSRFEPMLYDESTSSDKDRLRNADWDPRWLDAAIKADRPDMVSYRARPNHKAALNYLLALAGSKKASDPGMVVRALARCQYPKVTDFFLDLVAKKARPGKSRDYELQLLLESARYLPPADLPRLDAFAAKLDENFVDDFLVAISPLRPVG